MTEREALKLALEALEDLGMKHFESTGEVLYKETFTTLERCLANDALEKKADNARELGLDYEPVAWMFQHEETGRMMFVEAQQLEWGFEKGNPRLKKIRPLYIKEQL